MDLQVLQEFFFWCMIVNSAVYVISALATVVCRGFMCAVMHRVFVYDREETLRAVQGYLGNYKLLITVFNFAPWLAILIIK